MTVPSATQTWIQTVALHIDLAIAASRSRPTETTQAAADALDEAYRTGSELALGRLAQAIALSREEQLAAWCLIAGQLEPAIAARLEGLSGASEVTLGALAAIAYDARRSRAIEELGGEGKLVRFGLIESADDARGPTASWSRRTVRPTDRLLVLALEPHAARLDPSLAPFARMAEPVVVPDDLAIEPEVVARVRRAIGGQRATVIASGRPGLGRRTMLLSIAKDLGLEVLQIDARKLSRELPDLRTQLRHLARECMLLRCAPLVVCLDTLAPEAIELAGVELVSHVAGPVLATSGLARPAVRWDRPTIAIDVEPPGSAARAKMWLRALAQGSESDGDYLATTYPLAPAMIHHSARAALACADGGITPESIVAGMRSVLDDRLGTLARRIAVTQTWDDLVLAPEHVDTILELMSRVRERRRVYEQWGFAAKVGKGLGITALFSGPPGTGKTMVAGLIARDLGLELYQVDIGKIVSKWIGETEKQLGELFDAAEAGHAVLLFDEADALFGKRTEVKSSNDRYANLETNYLLQRLESFAGICLLTSNHASNIDPAFQRRLSHHLRFDLPDATERTRLWRAMMPSDAPIDGEVEHIFEDLAGRFAMSGGYIRNSALRAAFLAADERTSITAAHLERAARIEYEAIGKIAFANADLATS